ncbi:MAG: IscS subfamily cysteine desulfurase [Deltaproteobacteria bacterium]|nr:IscS subfamily cysteine desulfurase [Deltaproteobacteria bacterium]MBI2347412.1 IscS subfamily cysteine desulfurase [Deltaproteobacteria bacterium]
MKIPVYLDNHATTPVDPRVLEAMLPYFGEKFGNAASRSHAFGWEAEAAVDEAREQVAQIIQAASPREIVFTSGATESDNLAIKGVAESYRDKGDHIVTCATEHRAVLDSCKALERRGYRVTYLGVDRYGIVRLDQLREAVTDKTVLISVMAANNEIGTIQPIREIGQLAKEKGILYHCDATQGVGKIPMSVEEMGIDLLSLSGHKIYGPKGVGALYVRSKRPKVRLSPIIDGGGHERGMRSGTLNVPGIVGLGKACQIAMHELAREAARLTQLRARLKDGIFGQLDEVYVNGHPTQRLPGNLNVSFAHVEGESLMMALKEIAVSSGSACTSAALEPSYVLLALGIPEALAHTSIRFGLGRFNTEEEVDYAIRRVVEEVTRLRALSPLYSGVKAELRKGEQGEIKAQGRIS